MDSNLLLFLFFLFLFFLLLLLFLLLLPAGKQDIRDKFIYANTFYM